jgi:hypothetical protein
MKFRSTIALGALLLAAMTAAGSAADRPIERSLAPPSGIVQFSYAFTPLPLLPRRIQNHCGLYHGHFVCADHCGIDYQVYYCGDGATGCCHVGMGYCDFHAQLRCMPALF